MNIALNNSGLQYLYFQLQNWVDNILKLRQSTDESAILASIDEIPDFLINATDEELIYLENSLHNFQSAIENALQSPLGFTNNIDKLANEGLVYIQVVAYLVDKYKPELSDFSAEIKVLEDDIISKFADYLSPPSYETVKKSLQSVSKIHQADFMILGLEKGNYYEKLHDINFNLNRICDGDVPINIKLIIDNFNVPIFKWIVCSFSFFTLAENYEKYGSEDLVAEICEALNVNANQYIENAVIISHILDLYEDGQKGIKRAESFVKLKLTNPERFKNMVNLKIALKESHQAAQEAGLSEITMEEINQEVHAYRRGE